MIGKRRWARNSGQVNGWKRPNYCALPSFDNHAARRFRRGGWWEHARAEAQAIRETANIIDATAFPKHLVRRHLVRRPRTTAFLNGSTTNRLPEVGRLKLTHALTGALTGAGNPRTEYTLDFGHIDIHDTTPQWGVFALAGPNARVILNRLVRQASPETVLSNKRFPWLSMRNIELGMCPVRSSRVACTGELGCELHHPIEMKNHLWDQLMATGADHGLKPVGARAQNWLRQEKSYRAFGTELGRDATPR